MQPIFTADTRHDAVDALIQRHHNLPRVIFGGPAHRRGPSLVTQAANDEDRKSCIYLHGLLERRCGYDIPVFLGGAIERVAVQDATVIVPETGEEVASALVLCTRVWLMTATHGLIVPRADLEALLAQLRTNEHVRLWAA